MTGSVTAVMINYAVVTWIFNHWTIATWKLGVILNLYCPKSNSHYML